MTSAVESLIAMNFIDWNLACEFAPVVTLEGQSSISQEPVLCSLSHYWSKAALRPAGPVLGCIAATQLGTWLLAHGQWVSPGPSATSSGSGALGRSRSCLCPAERGPRSGCCWRASRGAAPAHATYMELSCFLLLRGGLFILIKLLFR